MTGFARASADLPAGKATLTLRSTNHRFLDLQLRLPSNAESLEPFVRSEIKRALARGHVDCTLTVEAAERPDSERPLKVPAFDRAALRAYFADFYAAAEEHGLGVNPDLNTAALVPGLLSFTKTPVAAPEADPNANLPDLLSRALASLVAARAQEGAALTVVMESSLDRLAGLAELAARLREQAQPAHLARLTGRIQALLGAEGDRSRLLTEAALLAERGDVEEELVRLRAHVAQFRSLLQSGGEAGKKLDFLLQEMNREANTLLSKTAGITGGAMELTEAGLAMKTEIEKLREQVQNIE